MPIKVSFTSAVARLEVGNDAKLGPSKVEVKSDGTNPVFKIEGLNNDTSVGRIAWQVTNQYSAGSMELYHWREGMSNNGSLNISQNLLVQMMMKKNAPKSIPFQTIEVSFFKIISTNLRFIGRKFSTFL